jgi:hypothetical protein
VAADAVGRAAGGGFDVDVAPGCGAGDARVDDGLILLLVADAIIQEPALGELTHLLLSRPCS